MLRVDIGAKRTPCKNSEWLLSDTRVDSFTILRWPDDECVVLSNTCKETVIWGESEFVYTFLDSLENNKWLPRLVAPENDWSIRCSLEDSTSLSSGNQLSWIWNGNSWELHIMASQELLLVLIMDILDNQKSTNVVNKGVFLSWMELYGICVFTVVTYWVLHLDDCWLAFR